MSSDQKGHAYLDAAEGLSRIGGNKALFSRLLDTFLKDKNWEKLCGFWAEDNFDEAAKCAHAIKGICANLSMKSLYETSGELEQSLKAGQKDEALLEAARLSRDDTLVAIDVFKAG